MFEIGNSLREARVRQQLELGRGRARHQDPRPLPAGARGGELRRAPGPDLRQGLPAHLRGLPRARRAALRRRVQLALRRRRGSRASRSSPRRTSNVARQHRRLERRWIAFALAGIAALVVFFIAAWKSGGNPNETIPNLGTTNTTPAKKVLPAATPTQARRDEAGLVPALRARARTATAGWRCATGRRAARRRFTGTVEPGQSQRFVARRLWVNFGNPGNLAHGLQRPRRPRGRPRLVPLHAARLLARRLSRPRGFVVVTGSELVRGDRRDLNGPFLASELLRLGVEPARISIVGDDPAELEAALREGLEADLCCVSGGLGPTHDDRTVELVARAAGRELVVDERARAAEIESISRAIAERLGPAVRRLRSRACASRRRCREGALVVGIAGTAPALVLETERGAVVVLPGPPSELQRLWPRALESEPVRRCSRARVNPNGACCASTARASPRSRGRSRRAGERATA